MQMPKPYDGATLVTELEKVGVSGGVDALIKAIQVTEDFLESSAKMSTEGLVGKFDDYAIPAEQFLEAKVISLLTQLKDKILTPAPATPVAG